MRKDRESLDAYVAQSPCLEIGGTALGIGQEHSLAAAFAEAAVWTALSLRIYCFRPAVAVVVGIAGWWALHYRRDQNLAV